MNIIKKIIKNPVPRVGLMAIALLLCFSTCRDYLDIVPDNTFIIDDLFTSRAEAISVLAKVYSYMPKEDKSDCTTWLLGDEYIGRSRYFTEGRLNRVMGLGVMRGLQSANNPLFGIWGGSNPSDLTSGSRFQNMYEAITACHLLIENIHKVPDMWDDEKDDWAAQAKFLMAYYHFLLLRKYGPIVISDKIVDSSAPKEDIFVERKKVDEVFDFIIENMNAAIDDLFVRRISLDYGQIDKIGAAAIRARVLLYRASPFWSGNSEYYADFLDWDKEPFFPIHDDAATTKAKWKDALDAADYAIALAEGNGKRLHRHIDQVYLFDEESFEENPERLQTLYDLRMIIPSGWNNEMLWGYSNMTVGGNEGDQGFPLTAITGLKIPPGFPNYSTGRTGQEHWLGATHKMMYRYYTENGLPLHVDRTFSSHIQHDVISTPSETDDEYKRYWGIMQPSHPTIRLYMERELRFYAHLGITGGYWRQHGQIIPTNMFRFQNDDTNFDEYHFPCGIGIQKLIHPESQRGDWRRQVRFPFPIIRLADLYLIRAEAMNEYLDEGMSREPVWATIDSVRLRAGIPAVNDAWSNLSFVKPEYINYHNTQAGMREIIQQERNIELAFEGHIFWDYIRTMRAVGEFSQPIFGWTVRAEEAADFFVLQMIDERYFKTSFCLWPVWNRELDTNSRIIQNPGW